MSSNPNSTLSPNEDRHLDELLRSLPREDTSPGFTAGVMARVRDLERPRAFFHLTLERAVLAAALVFMTLAGGLLVRQKIADVKRHASIARIEAMETERAALEAELLALQRDARDAQGVIYLGSTPEVDMVLDMGRLARRRAASNVRDPNVRPAVAVPGGELPRNANYR